MLRGYVQWFDFDNRAATLQAMEFRAVVSHALAAPLTFSVDNRGRRHLWRHGGERWLEMCGYVQWFGFDNWAAAAFHEMEAHAVVSYALTTPLTVSVDCGDRRYPVRLGGGKEMACPVRDSFYNFVRWVTVPIMKVHTIISHESAAPHT